MSAQAYKREFKMRGPAVCGNYFLCYRVLSANFIESHQSSVQYLATEDCAYMYDDTSVLTCFFFK